MDTKFKDNFNNFILAKGRRGLKKLEKLIVSHSLIGNKTFFSAEEFDWVINLEKNWQVIRQEVDLLLDNVGDIPNIQDISPDQYALNQDNLWKSFFLYALGLKAEKNCLKCPETTRLIETIPGMKTAFFSILLPSKHIPKHKGYYKGVIRCHLGLKTPQTESNCGIRVGNDIRYWQEGKSLIFDDTFPHEAWNNTDEIRVILLIDFTRPMSFPLNIINQGLIKLIATSPSLLDKSAIASL